MSREALASLDSPASRLDEASPAFLCLQTAYKASGVKAEGGGELGYARALVHVYVCVCVCETEKERETNSGAYIGVTSGATRHRRRLIGRSFFPPPTFLSALPLCNGWLWLTRPLFLTIRTFYLDTLTVLNVSRGELASCVHFLSSLTRKRARGWWGGKSWGGSNCEGRRRDFTLQRGVVVAVFRAINVTISPINMSRPCENRESAPKQLGYGQLTHLYKRRSSVASPSPAVVVRLAAAPCPGCVWPLRS